MNLAPLVPAAAGAAAQLAGSIRHTAGRVTSSFAAVLEAAAGSDSTQVAESAKKDESDDAAFRLADQSRLASTHAAVLDRPLDLVDIEFDIDEALPRWHGQLVDRLREAGIDVSDGVELVVRPGDGKIVLTGEHPQREAIEQLLAEDRELSDEFRRINASLELLQAGKRHLEFAAAYEKDPVAAVERFAHLFDKRPRPPIHFQINDLEARPSFD